MALAPPGGVWDPQTRCRSITLYIGCFLITLTKEYCYCGRVRQEEMALYFQTDYLFWAGFYHHLKTRGGYFYFDMKRSVFYTYKNLFTQRGLSMQLKTWAVVVVFLLTGQLASAISPEAARKELAQESIPYTAEALFSYVDKGATDVVGWFLAIGMDVNAKNEFGETALMNAAEQGHLDLVSLLLRHGADINARDLARRTALMNAAQNGHAVVVKLLLSRGATVNAASQWKSTALHEACMNGHYDVVQTLLNAGANANLINNAGHTALMEAVIEGHESVARLLISRGADVNFQDLSGFSDGETPLMVAAAKGETGIAALLLAKGADVNRKTKDGQTALMVAIMAPGERSEIARLLIESGADVNTKDRHKMTALAYALKKRDVQLFKILMESGARE